LEAVFRSAAKARVNGIIMVGSRSINRYAKQIVELALKNRLPSMFEISTRVEAGGLMSYSADDAALFRRAAVYVDKILKGAKPADLPIEQPTKFEFVINLKTAKALNLTIPQSVLFRADRVINKKGEYQVASRQVEGEIGEAMKKKVNVLTLSALLFALCFPVWAQQPKNIPRIGYLTPSISANRSLFEAFQQGLRELGYVEGKNMSLNGELMKEN
jgi:ABC transporter substrate binding protein